MAKQITIEEDNCPTRTITIVPGVRGGGAVPSGCRQAFNLADLVLAETTPVGEKRNKRKCKILKDKHRRLSNAEILLIPARHQIVFTDSKTAVKYEQYTNILIIQNYV